MTSLTSGFPCCNAFLANLSPLDWGRACSRLLLRQSLRPLKTAESHKIVYTFYFAQPGVFHQEMNRLESKKHSPAQVFAQFTSASESEGIPGAKTNCKHKGKYASDNRREIQITESGEVSLPPDKARVSIVCSNAKVSDQYFTVATVNCCCMYIY